MTTRRSSQTPEQGARPTANTPFDIERYMPSPEAYQEVADDHAAEELLRRCLDRPEVKALQEDLHAADAEERRAAERSEVAVHPEPMPQRGPAAPTTDALLPGSAQRGGREWSLLTRVILATVAVVTPAALVWYFAARPTPAPLPPAVSLSAAPVAPTIVAETPPQLPSATATASAAPTPRVPPPRPSGLHPPRATPSAPPSAPATSSELPKVIN